MSSNDQIYTTNAEDQAAVKELQARIASSSPDGVSKSPSSNNFQKVPSVIVANGAHKYVLIAAKEPESGTNDDNNDNDPSETYFVTSKRGAHYHVNAAEPVIERLETSGYSNIRVLGGGRIFLDDETKKISIFGYSYGFGRADHQISQMIIEADNRYKNYDVSWSNDGY